VLNEPWWSSARPKSVEELVFAIRVHRLPEPLMAESPELAALSKCSNRLALEHAVIGAKQVEKGALEHEVAGADPVMQQGLLAEPEDDVVRKIEHAKP
jgi:hypothetical protein